MSTMNFSSESGDSMQNNTMKSKKRMKIYLVSLVVLILLFIGLYGSQVNWWGLLEKKVVNKNTKVIDVSANLYKDGKNRYQFVKISGYKYVNAGSDLVITDDKKGAVSLKVIAFDGKTGSGQKAFDGEVARLKDGENVFSPEAVGRKLTIISNFKEKNQYYIVLVQENVYEFVVSMENGNPTAGMNIAQMMSNNIFPVSVNK